MSTNSNRWPVDGAYELLKGMIGELWHQLGRLQEALARRDDHFSSMLEETYRSR